MGVQKKNITDRDKIRDLLNICAVDFRETSKTIFMKDRKMVFDDEGCISHIVQDGLVFTEDH